MRVAAAGGIFGQGAAASLIRVRRLGLAGLALALAAGPLAAQTLQLRAPGVNSETLDLTGLTLEQTNFNDYLLEWSLDRFATVAGSQKMGLGGSGLSAVVTGLTTGKAYEFRAKRLAWVSNTVRAVPVQLVAPDAKVAELSALGAKLSWTTPAPAGGTSFRVEYSSSPAFTSPKVLTTSSASALVNICQGSTGYLRVAVVGSTPPVVGPNSGVLTATIPSGVTGTLAAPTPYPTLPQYGALEFSWMPVKGATFYRVSRVNTDLTTSSMCLLTQADPLSNRFTTPNLGVGVTATYVLQSCTSAGCGPYSKKMTGVTGSTVTY